MKKYVIPLVALALLTTSFTTIAKSENAGSGTGNQAGSNSPAEDSSGKNVSNKNAIKTQNQGQDTNLMINTQEMENEENDSIGIGNSKPKSGKSNPRSENAKAHMSAVAQAVEELLASPERQGGIGKEIREIAKAQNDAQLEITEELENIDARPGWVKKIFGFNRQAVKNMEKLMEQNQERIRQMEQLQNQVVNQADQTQLQETIQSMIEQNSALEEQIQAEQELKGIFEWITTLLKI